MLNKKEWSKKYYQKNKEKLKEYDKKYKKENSEKFREYQKKYRKENPEKVKERFKKWYQKNSEKMKNHKQKKLEKQANRKKPEQCEICGAFGKDLKKGLCYDHDHKTDKFRGWICGRCNFVLGLVKDNSELLDALAKYIRK